MSLVRRTKNVEAFVARAEGIELDGDHATGSADLDDSLECVVTGEPIVFGRPSLTDNEVTVLTVHLPTGTERPADTRTRRTWRHQRAGECRAPNDGGAQLGQPIGSPGP
jgi:hypothetical protein